MEGRCCHLQEQRKEMGGGGNKNNNDVYSPFPSFLLLPAGTSLVRFQQGLSFDCLSLSLFFLLLGFSKDPNCLSLSLFLLSLINTLIETSVCTFCSLRTRPAARSYSLFIISL